MGISFVLLSTATWPRTTPRVWSTASMIIRRRPDGPVAPPIALPSPVIKRRTPEDLVRRCAQAPSTRSSSSPSTRCRIRRIVDSHGTIRPQPNRASSSEAASAARWAIATYDLAPAITAHAAIAGIMPSRCRRPRPSRGSATCRRALKRIGPSMSGMSVTRTSWPRAGSTGHDTEAGMVPRRRSQRLETP